MRSIIIDRDKLTTQLLSSRIEALGHDLVIESSKSKAVELLEKEEFDLILVDPLPLNEARPVILSIFKAICDRYSPYIFLLSKTFSEEGAISAGANDLIAKPLDTMIFDSKIKNAERLLARCRELAVENEFPSEGGIIGKSAFNQLFLSSVDRAHRYGERSYTVFLNLENRAELEDKLDAQTYQEFIDAFQKRVVSMRRQSDVIGRIDTSEYAVLLQRPLYEQEPFDAATRFTEFLSQFCHDHSELKAHISLRMMEIPIGEEHMASHVGFCDTDTSTHLAQNI